MGGAWIDITYFHQWFGTIFQWLLGWLLKCHKTMQNLETTYYILGSLSFVHWKKINHLMIWFKNYQVYNNLQYDKIGDLQTVSVRSHFRAHTSAGVCLQSGAKLLLNSHTRTRAATHIWCAIASKIPAHKQFGDLCYKSTKK